MFKNISIFALSLVLLVGCEALDPDSVVNPNLSAEAVIGQPNSAQIWLNGIHRELAVMMNENVIISEIASDNYVNTATYFNQYLDGLDINYQDADINRSQFHIARLREMARFGVEQVGPNDPNYDAATQAGFEFFWGLANLYAGMYYKGMAGEAEGVILTKNTNLSNAIMHFTNALNLDNADVRSMIGRARAHYLLGDDVSAIADCDAAIAADPAYVFFAEFDPLNSTGTNINQTLNEMQEALYGRGSFDDLQPLPSLDFLDPKFSFVAPGVDAAIPMFKIEEAHLIKAEALQSQGNAGGAIQELTDLFTVIAGRPIRSINDGSEDRIQNDPGSRPDSTDITVDGRAGLVLHRKAGNVDVPSVSGTSYTAADLAGLSGDALLEMIYRIRQEVFIAEGIRSVDMGITWVLSQNEYQLNDNASDADIMPDIPPYLAAISANIDDITYDKTARTCTIDNDINALIVANKTTDYVCPFH